MTPETGEPDRCLKDPVSERTVMSAEEPRALSVRTAPVLFPGTCVPGSLRGVHRRQNLR